MQTQQWQCRWAPSIGALAGTAEKTWGTVPYTDDTQPCVFFGLYGLPDFYALWRHKGRRAILWAGTDITHFLQGYWLDDKGEIKLDPAGLAKWIDKNCENYVENKVEAAALWSMGIESTVVPSFLGDIDDYNIEFKPTDKVRVYASVSGDNFEQYGWDRIDDLADKHKDIEFHLYGSDNWTSEKANVIVHGRVPAEQMNAEIKTMNGGLRLTQFDGFSEILAKSVLWGQWPVSPYIEYPNILRNLFELWGKKEPNFAGRDYYREHCNQYPWNSNVI